MDSSFHSLQPLFYRERAAHAPIVLATVIETAGSTYRKAGAQMLFDRHGEYAGLLSGGCLEADLQAHAARLLAGDPPRIVSYDMRGPDDQIWGLGSGCEGAMKILLQRLDAAQQWQPLQWIEAQRARGGAAQLAVRIDAAALGQWERYTQNAATSRSNDNARRFILTLAPPTRLLICGAGPDAWPVAQLAVTLGWRVRMIDHRSAYTARITAHTEIELQQVSLDELAATVAAPAADAAVVMSHHLLADSHYLRALSGTATGFIGLLGPPPRRDKLLADLGSECAAQLRSRLRAPVGLHIGARTPEAIAVSIVAEVQSYLTDLQ